MSLSRYRVRVDGVDHEVEVERTDAGAFVVVVDGQRMQVVRSPDRAWRVQTGRDDAAGHHTVYLGPGATKRDASVAGVTATVEVQSAQQAALADALAVSRGTGSGGASVLSPMPGRVVRVLVDEGAQVEADEPLIIVEAMKMENEVRAPSAGVVQSIPAAAGDTVEAGQLLLELAPHADSAAS